MASNLSAMTEYIAVHQDELIVKASLGAKSLKYFDKMLGVKHSDIVPRLDPVIVFKDGSECTWSGQTSDTWGELKIEVNPLEVNKEYCQREFEKTFGNYQLKWAAGLETMPYEEKVIEANLQATEDALEDVIWSTGATFGVKGLQALAAEQSASTVNVTFTSAQTIDEKVDAMVAAIPNLAFKAGRDGKVNLFMSYTDFRSYVQAMNQKCCGKVGLLDAASEEIVYAGDSRVIIVPVAGLENANKMFAAPYEGFVYGTDIENSESIYDWFFDRVDANYKLRILFMAGLQIKYPTLTVVGA